MATFGASSATGASMSSASSSYCCTSAMATNVLLMDPTRKCVSAVTGDRAIAVGEADAARPLDALRPHQRDARARHAGLAQDLARPRRGTRRAWRAVGRRRRGG